MDSFRRRNGQLIAILISALSAYFLADTFIEDIGSSDPLQLRVLAALAAAAMTWLCWWIMVARARAWRIFRGIMAGLVAGILMHPVYVVALSWMGLFDPAQFGEYFLVAVVHIFLFTMFLIPGTMSIGALGGALAVLLGTPPEDPRPTAPRDLDVRRTGNGRPGAKSAEN